MSPIFTTKATKSGLVLEGDLTMGDLNCRPGDFHLAAKAARIGGDDDVGVPSLSIDSALMGARQPPVNDAPIVPKCFTGNILVRLGGESARGHLRAATCDVWNCAEKVSFWASEPVSSKEQLPSLGVFLPFRRITMAISRTSALRH